MAYDDALANRVRLALGNARLLQEKTGFWRFDIHGPGKDVCKRGQGAGHVPH
jgi:hypothetical protein